MIDFGMYDGEFFPVCSKLGWFTVVFSMVDGGFCADQMAFEDGF